MVTIISSDNATGNIVRGRRCPALREILNVSLETFVLQQIEQ
jgi:hypothetical protein